MQSLGYTVHHDILNALDFGLPQKRERTFIVGFLDENIELELVYVNDVVSDFLIQAKAPNKGGNISYPESSQTYKVKLGELVEVFKNIKNGRELSDSEITPLLEKTYRSYIK